MEYLQINSIFTVLHLCGDFNELLCFHSNRYFQYENSKNKT